MPICPRAVFFDVDGVLVDSLPQHLQMCHDKAVEFGLELKIPSLDEFRQLVRRGTKVSPMRYFFLAVGFPEDLAARAVAHRAGEQFVVDLVRGTSGQFDPQEVTKQYAALVKEYRIGSVVGDAYASEWVRTAWANAGVSYVRSELPKSQLYLECAPLFARGLVKLPDHPKLLRELRLLERHTHRSGRDTVDHPRNEHDDLANSCCGVLRSLSNSLSVYTAMDWVCGPDVDVAPAAAGSVHTVSLSSDFQRQQFANYVASGAGQRPPWAY